MRKHAVNKYGNPCVSLQFAKKKKRKKNLLIRSNRRLKSNKQLWLYQFNCDFLAPSPISHSIESLRETFIRYNNLFTNPSPWKGESLPPRILRRKNKFNAHIPKPIWLGLRFTQLENFIDWMRGEEKPEAIAYGPTAIPQLVIFFIIIC